MFKKTYKNIPILDLCGHTADSLKKIRRIKNVAVLIIPKERSAEWTAAYTDIGTENVARIIELDKGQKYHIINGSAILTDEETNDGEIFIVNGSCILETRENVPELYVNGMLIKRKNARCKLKITAVIVSPTNK